MMTKQQFRAMLQSLADAWSRRDYANAARFFAENIHYADPVRYSFNNLADLRRFFEDDEGYPQVTVWHTVVFDEEQQLGAAEYTFTGTHRYHGTVLIRIKHRKVTHRREYQHIDSKEWEEFASETPAEQPS